MVAITATAPRLTPTITHRIQLGIYGSFKACEILFIVSWACAVLFCHFIYRLGHCNICNVPYILSTVILICSTSRLRLCRLGTYQFFIVIMTSSMSVRIFLECQGSCLQVQSCAPIGRMSTCLQIAPCELFYDLILFSLLRTNEAVNKRLREWAIYYYYHTTW
jgi:hypothetical protein